MNRGIDIPVETDVSDKTLRVVVIEDHEVTRDGIVSVLGRADIVTVGAAATAGEAVQVIEECSPDVVLLDIRLPDESGIKTLKRIAARFPSLPVLILTSHGHPSLARAALDGGAAGFLLKRIDSKRLADSVWRVARGEKVYEDVDVIEPQPNASESSLSRLSGRQIDVLELIGEGLTNREIAGRLGLSEKTVKNYVSAILERIGVPTRSAAAAYVARAQALREPHLPPEAW